MNHPGILIIHNLSGKNVIKTLSNHKVNRKFGWILCSNLVLPSISKSYKWTQSYQVHERQLGTRLGTPLTTQPHGLDQNMY